MEETKDHKYIREHFRELLSDYKGKFILVRNERVLDAFESSLAAYKFAKTNFPDGLYVIKEMHPDAIKPLRPSIRTSIPV